MARMWTHWSAKFWVPPNLRESLTTFVTLLRCCHSYVDSSIAPHWLLQAQQLEFAIAVAGLSEGSAIADAIDHLFRSRRGFVVERHGARAYVGAEACLMRANIQAEPDLERPYPTSRLVERIVFSLCIPPEPTGCGDFHLTVSGLGEAPQRVLRTTVGEDPRWSIRSLANIRLNAKLLYGEQAIALGLEAAPIYRDFATS